MRYRLVGILSNLTGYLVYLLLTAFVLPPLVTMTLLYLTAALIGFFGNRRFTFHHTGKLGRARVQSRIPQRSGPAGGAQLLVSRPQYNPDVGLWQI